MRFSYLTILELTNCPNSHNLLNNFSCYALKATNSYFFNTNPPGLTRHQTNPSLRLGHVMITKKQLLLKGKLVFKRL